MEACTTAICGPLESEYYDDSDDEWEKEGDIERRALTPPRMASPRDMDKNATVVADYCPEIRVDAICITERYVVDECMMEHRA